MFVCLLFMLIRYNGGVAKGNAMATEQEVNMSPFILEGELQGGPETIA